MKNSHFSTQYTLTILGDKIHKKVAIPPDQLLFDVIARGNDPFSSISFELKNDDISGWVDLNQESNKATLQRLEDEDVLSPWSIYVTSSSDIGHGTYQIHDQTSQIYLNLQFNNAPILYHPNQMVTVTGQLQFQIPQHWAAVQPNRFPKVAVQGQFVFDGKPYHLVQTNTVFEAPNDRHRISYTLTFKHQNERLDFSFEQDSAFTPPLIRITANDQLYQLTPSAYNKIWMENNQRIAITAENLTFKSNHGQTKQLNADLMIPKNYANLTINQHPAILIPTNSSIVAEARNEQKSYNLAFFHQNNMVYLELIEEGDGHFSLQYTDSEGERPYCGDSNTPCIGLSTQSSKQRFYLKQVKLGKYTFDGEIFIAGVL